MSSCPSGHRSTTADVCDVCGLRLRPTPPGQSPPAIPHGPAEPPSPRAAVEPRGGPCPVCATPRTGRFCEECGFDFVSRSGGRRSPSADPGHGVSWLAIVTADPAYYQYMADQGRLDTSQIPFPAHHRQRRVRLRGSRVHIGRHSARRGFTPEIDLGGPDGDPAVSRVHAILLPASGGTWAVLDPGSVNGTTINGAADPIPRNVEVPLNDSDRIYVGAWTAITLRKG
ncbi:FHA domain-containing protein [Nocardiopsis sp. FIRDI 009]|uniref:FHA domain-containing protein n=1 Tax=Nocardiopsis sp. FIRDI 009 TaxID=714197 RepID=UPI000E25236C|nr:FHA domain-containing protein [Nocardiopsis sp. FIRDI 009]